MDKFHYDILEGKRLLIVIIILFSSFSFTLGFFVGRTIGHGQTAKNASTKTLTGVVAVKGEESTQSRPKRDSVPPLPSDQKKNGQDNPPNQAKPAASDPRQAPSRAPAQAAQEIVEEEMPRQQEIGQESLHQEPQQQKPAPSPKAPPPKKAAVAAQKSLAPVPAAVSPALVQSAPASSAQPAQAQELKKQQPKPAAPPHEPVKTVSAETVKEKSPALDKDQAQGEGKERFFIQAGAFKSIEQAHSLREQLQLQGFECQILKQSIKDQPVLFKVRIGDYDSRHDAVLVLSRLNKKGFKAFIRGYTR